MKAFLISDNVDTLVGLQIAGINGIVLHSKDEIEFVIDKLLQDRNIAIIILTERAASMVEERIAEIKLNREIPLVVEIPDRHGSIKGNDYILRYIKDSIGLKL